MGTIAGLCASKTHCCTNVPSNVAGVKVGQRNSLEETGKWFLFDRKKSPKDFDLIVHYATRKPYREVPIFEGNHVVWILSEDGGFQGYFVIVFRLEKLSPFLTGSGTKAFSYSRGPTTVCKRFLFEEYDTIQVVCMYLSSPGTLPQFYLGPSCGSAWSGQAKRQPN